MSPEKTKAIILFDGVCNLCNALVQFVIRHDPEQYFRFASLQSEAGRALLAKHDLAAPETPESLVLLEGGKVRRYSSAALHILRHLKSWHRLFFPLIYVPAFLRDPVYRFIARHRYRWFGKQDTCWLPEPELNERFL